MQLQPQGLVTSSTEERELGRCALAQESLRRFGRLRFRAYGTSMLPAIWPGEVLLVEALPPSQAQPGEVWLTAQHGRLVAHRVLRVEGPAEPVSAVCRGDFLDVEDPAVSGDAILGKVTGVYRYGGKVAVPPVSAGNMRLGRWLRRSSRLRGWMLRWHRLRQQRAAASGHGQVAEMGYTRNELSLAAPVQRSGGS